MQTRIIVGTILALVAVGVFFGDHLIGPPYPFLLLLASALAVVASIEFMSMMPAAHRRFLPVVVGGSLTVLLSHWLPVLSNRSPALSSGLVVFAAWVIGAFVIEMQTVERFGESVNRIAVAVLGIAYLGVLAGFLVDLRLRQPSPLIGTLSLVLAVFVPKACDIGAYFAGSFFGKHPMAPVLSPKKTWEGAAGGLAASVAVAVGVQNYHPVIPGGWIGTIVFGLAVGAVGIAGDLAESLIKRDSGVKDSARLIPGFGGVLDVIDAVLFAAPVVYLWLSVSHRPAPGV